MGTTMTIIAQMYVSVCRCAPSLPMPTLYTSNVEHADTHAYNVCHRIHVTDVDIIINCILVTATHHVLLATIKIALIVVIYHVCPVTLSARYAHH